MSKAELVSGDVIACFQGFDVSDFIEREVKEVALLIGVNVVLTQSTHWRIHLLRHRRV